MHARPCPTYLQLLDRLTGALLADPQLEAHLDGGCPDCVRREGVLRTILRVAAEPAWPEMPPGWRERAVALARPAATRRPAARTHPPRGPRVREILARLLRDAGDASSPAVALRGPGPAEHHLLFEADPFEIDLALFDSGALVGQVFATDGDAAPLEAGICVLYSPRAIREAALEDGGDFHFERVRPGAYDLLLETPSVRLFVRDVDLGGAPREEEHP